MARKSKSVEVDVVETPDDDDPMTPEESDILIALGELEGASDAKWKLHRIAPLFDGKSAGYCDSFSSSELDMGQIRDRFGRGSYRLIGHTSKGQYIKTVTFSIATDASKPAAPAPINTGGDVLAILAQRDAAAAAKRSEMMSLIIPAAISTLPAILAALKPASAPDPLTMIAALKTLQPEQPKAPDMMPLITALLAKAGDGGSETNWMDLVKEAVQQLPGVMAQMKSAQPAQPQRVQVTSQASSFNPNGQQISAPVAFVPEETAQSQEGDDVNIAKLLRLKSWAQKTLQDLSVKAAKNADPVLYADHTLDNIPDDVDIAEFVKYLSEPAWWDYLKQFEPAVTPYQGWFAEFRDAVIDIIEENATSSAPDLSEVPPLASDDDADV